MHPLAAIVWKDLLLDLRTKEMVIPMLIFAMLVCVIFNFVFDPAPKIVIIVVPGVLWVSFTFAGILGLTRSFMLEKECESIEGLMVCPISRDTIYLGKFLSGFMLLIIFEFIMLPIFASAPSAFMLYMKGLSNMCLACWTCVGHVQHVWV